MTTFLTEARITDITGPISGIVNKLSGIDGSAAVPYVLGRPGAATLLKQIAK